MADLAKVEQLEVKLAEEMESLNEKLQTLEEDTLKISDIEAVKANMEMTKNVRCGVDKERWMCNIFLINPSFRKILLIGKVSFMPAITCVK